MTAPVVESIEKAEALDRPAAALAAFHGAYQRGPVKAFLRGDWIGHALHPLLTDVPIGTWTSALLLDALGADDEATTALLVAGVASVPLVAISGWSDWHDGEEGSSAIRRVGIVHAAVTGSAAALQIASVGARRSGSRGRGTVLSAAAMVLVGAGGWLGGHLTYARGSRVQRVTDGRRFTPSRPSGGPPGRF